jgi:hypothetical protein
MHNRLLLHFLCVVQLWLVMAQSVVLQSSGLYRLQIFFTSYQKLTAVNDIFVLEFGRCQVAMTVKQPIRLVWYGSI